MYIYYNLRGNVENLQSLIMYIFHYSTIWRLWLKIRYRNNWVCVWTERDAKRNPLDFPLWRKDGHGLVSIKNLCTPAISLLSRIYHYLRQYDPTRLYQDGFHSRTFSQLCRYPGTSLISYPASRTISSIVFDLFPRIIILYPILIFHSP